MILAAIALSTALFLSGCVSSSEENLSGTDTACLNGTSTESPVANESDGRIVITNNNDELDQLIACKDTIIPIADASGTNAAKPGSGSFELVLVAEVPPPSIVGQAAFVGAGSNDLTAGGTYTGTSITPPFVRYVVEIDAAGAPDSFRWSEDKGTTWTVSGVAITGAGQVLSNGVTITFDATTGHTLGDAWHIDAGITQATSVAITGNTALVGFGMAGAPYLGAVQVFGLTGKTVRLRSQAVFRDMDVNAVTASGSAVYVTGAHEPIGFGAILQQLTLGGSKLSLVGAARELTTFVGTGVAHDAASNKVLVTDGNAGGLSYLNDATLAVEDYAALDDARGVDQEGTLAVVVQGCCGASTGGAITVFDLSAGTLAAPASFAFSGADVAEAKSTVELVGQKAFVAAGSGGAQVLSTNDGTVLATVPNPIGTGLDPSVVVTNAASVDKDLMFISNGEAGVYVAQNGTGNFDASGAGGPVDITVLGGLQFGSLESVNHVEFKSGFLFVAAGLGGVKIVRIDQP